MAENNHNNDDLRAIRRGILAAVQAEGTPGRLGRRDGQLSFTDATGTTYRDRVWVTLDGAKGEAEIVAINHVVPRSYNLPVRVAVRDGVHTIIGIDGPYTAQYSGGRPVATAEHAWMHSRPGPDPLYVSGLQVLPLMATPTSPPSMAVTVARAVYRYGGELKLWDTGDSADLSAYIPAASNVQHFVIICLDRANNALVIVDGTDSSSDALHQPGTYNQPFTAAEVAAVGIDDAYYPICAVRFYTGMTHILAPDIIYDVRLWGGETGVAPVDHDHSGDAGDGGTFDAANLTSGAATDGQVLTADGAGGAAWETPSGVSDAADVTYTPAAAANWNGGTDPGNVDDALDQLASRTSDLEDGSSKDLFTATASQTVANTVTETTLLGSGEGSLTLAANFFTAGKALRIHMRGQLGDTGTPTLNVKLKLGSTVIAETGVTSLTGVTGVEWMLDILLTCRSAGASGSVIAGGLFDYDDGSEISLSSGTAQSVDTTGSLVLDVTATWGTADEANTITCQEAIVEAVDPNSSGEGGGGGGGGYSTYTATYANRPAASNDGDLFLPSDGFVLERDTGAAWMPWGPLFPLAGVANAPTTWVNQGDAIVSTIGGGIVLTDPAQSDTSISYTLLVKPAPATPYTITAFYLLPPPLSSINYVHALLMGWRASSSGAFSMFRVYYSTAFAGWRMTHLKASSPTVEVGNYTNSAIDPRGPLQYLWVRIADNGTNRSISLSNNGHTFDLFHSVSRTDFLTPDQVGFGLGSRNASFGISLTLLSWKEA
mgnify:CR=1 FL=1